LLLATPFTVAADKQADGSLTTNKVYLIAAK
jgi:hypothetical protein